MAPPADIPKVPGIGLPPPAPSPPAPPEPPPGSRGQAPPAPQTGVDLADIRPLDVPHALQILIAEVRAELEAALLQAGSPAPPAPLAPPGAGTAQTGTFAALSGEPRAPAAAAPEAARQMIEALLRALPEETADEQPLAAVLPRLLQAVQAASARSLAIVESWRDVPAPPREAAQAAVQLVANALGEEPLLAAWLRPEWASFAPRLERFRRRKRRLHRRLQDPDAARGRPEDEDEDEDEGAPR